MVCSPVSPALRGRDKRVKDSVWPWLPQTVSKTKRAALFEWDFLLQSLFMELESWLVVRAFDGLSNLERLVSVLRTHVVVHHPSSRGSDTIFWLPVVAKHM